MSAQNQRPAPVRLDHAQWLEVNRLATEIQACSSPEDLVEIATVELPKLLSADWAGWNEHDHRIRLLKVHMSPAFKEVSKAYNDAINHHMASHPVVKGMDLINNPRILTDVWNMTDFTPATQLDRAAIWTEAYRHMNAKHQLSSQFCTDGRNGVLLTLNNEKAFNEQQRMMLKVLTSHFQAACKRLALNIPLRATDGSRPRLTSREQEILMIMLDGKTNPEIAIITGTSAKTVEKHVTRILDAFQVENRLHLLSLVLRQRQPGAPHYEVTPRPASSPQAQDSNTPPPSRRPPS